MEPVIQWVQVTWTKASRGAPGAAIRNAVPSAYPLPVTQAPLVHDVIADESDGFSPRSSWDTGSGDQWIRRPGHPSSVRHGEVEIRPRGDDLRVRLRPTLMMAGPPRRRRPSAVLLAPGERVRWVINFRFSGYRGWSYSQVTMNLANGEIPPGAFLQEPTTTIDERLDLF